MIDLFHYFGSKMGHPDATDHRVANAALLLDAVDALLTAARTAGFYRDEIDPDTGTVISGSRGGHGDGGFRLQTSTTGAVLSEHREGCAIDIYDPFDMLDSWLTDELLEQFGLYREHPDATPGWCHLQSRPPRSGKRTFWP